MVEIKNKRIIVFASGTGTNFINLYNNVINGKIILLVSNNPNCAAVKFAIQNKIDISIINTYRFPIEKNKNKQYEIVLNSYKPDLILLAGFMKKIPENIIALYNYKIINVHPSLLPRFGGKGFYGVKVHEAVIKSGDSFTGVTIHFVNGKYDKGLIIMQEQVAVDKKDNAQSLSKKVLKKEYELYLKVVNLFCKEKIRIENNLVIINE